MDGQGNPRTAGWYEQAGNPGVLRYFDGQWWTTQSRPKTPDFPGIALGLPAAAPAQPPADDPYTPSWAAPTGGRFGASAGDPFAPAPAAFGPAPFAAPAGAAPAGYAPPAAAYPAAPTAAYPAPMGSPSASAPFVAPGFAPPAGPARATDRFAPAASTATNPFAPPVAGVPMPAGPAATADAFGPTTSVGAWQSAPPPAWGPGQAMPAVAVQPWGTGAPLDPSSGGWGQTAWSGDPWQQARPAPAHWGWRVLSYVVDYLVVALPTWVLAIVVGFVYGLRNGAQGIDPDPAFYSGLQVALQGLVYVMWFVNRSVYGGRTGRSLGRVATGTRLVRADTGQPLGVWMAFVRDIAHMLDGLSLGLGYLWPLWDQKRQTFADKAVSSVVVR